MDIHIEVRDAHCLPLTAGSVDLFFADPPYNIGIKYADGIPDRMPSDLYTMFTMKWIDEAIRVLSDTGTLWFLLPDELVADAVLYCKNSKLTMRNWIKWYETFGNNCKTKFSRTSRHLLYFVKDPKSFTFNADAVRIPSARQTKYKDKRAKSGGKVPDDVWEISRICGTFKERIEGAPTQLPVKLLERVILSTSNPGDLVVDPFCGSGTTPFVCKETGRRCCAYDLSRTYVSMAKQRCGC